MSAKEANKAKSALQAMAAEALALKRAKTRAFRARIRGEKAKIQATEGACEASITQIYEIARKGNIPTRVASGAIMKSLRDARDALSAQEMDALADADAQPFLTLSAKAAPAGDSTDRGTDAPRPSATVIAFRPRKQA